jgi:hypothetical protein
MPPLLFLLPLAPHTCATNLWLLYFLGKGFIAAAYFAVLPVVSLHHSPHGRCSIYSPCSADTGGAAAALPRCRKP